VPAMLLRRPAHSVRRSFVLALAISLVVTSVPLLRSTPAAAAAGDPFRFIYDQAGRLVAAVTATDSARYAYDAVGNITSISRVAATTLSVIEFAPHTGTVGASVTVYGTAFSPTPSANIVKFNGVQATVISSTTTEIVTTVPSGATTGTISVKVGTPTATSSAAFSVTPSLTPTISSFTPSGVPGDTITISGTNFETNVLYDRVQIGGTFARVTAATATSLTVIVPPVVQSGKVVVATPNGTATSTGDFYSPPAGFTVADIGPTGRLTFGQASNFTWTVGGSVGLFLIDGTTPHRVTMTLSGGPSQGFNIWLLNPDGTVLLPGNCCSATFIDVVTLPMDGTYEVVVDASGTGTGSLTLTPYDLPADFSAAITPTQTGASVAVNIVTPGQNGHLTFSGTSGQRISVWSTFASWSIWFAIRNPDGTYAYGPAGQFNGDYFLDVVQLNQTGTFTIDIDPPGAATGPRTFTVYDVPADFSAAITLGGPAVTVPITTPGQNATLTFSATPGQKIQVTSPSASWTMVFGIKNPDGMTYAYGPVQANGALDTAIITLSQSGTYTMEINPSGAGFGNRDFTLADQGFGAAPVRVLLATVSTGDAGALLVRPAAAPLTAPENVPVDPEVAEDSWAPGTSARGGWRNVDSAPTATGDANASLVQTVSPAPRARATTAATGIRPSLASLGRAPWVHARVAAASGILTGEVRDAEGTLLAGVRVWIDDVSGVTDALGRFRLEGLPAGHAELWVDGRALRRGNFGMFEIGIDVSAAGVTALPFTVYLTRIDDAHAITIPSPTTAEVVLTSPKIPGLEVHIAPGTVITDAEGNTVTELSLTELSRARPPFPLPSLVETPVYFTVQPGGAYLSRKARVYYPNTYGRVPGTRAQFWHYDPEGEGWYVYGEGQVSADGRFVVPDPGVGLYELTGAMIHFPNLPLAALWAALGDFFAGGDPVDLGTGLFVLDKTDLVAPDVLPLTLARTYRSQDTTSRYFGIGATSSMELFLRLVTAWQEIDLILPDGARVPYLRTSPGNDQGGMFEHSASPTRFYKSTLHWNGATWDLVLRDGTKYNFNANSTLGFVSDRFGNRVTLVRNGGGISPHIDIARSPNGRWMKFSYDGSDRISSVTDNIGRTVGYTYDASGRLWKVTDAFGKVTEYGYDAAHRMTTIKDPRLITFLTNEYDPVSGRVSKQTQADTTFFLFSYVVDGSGNVTQANVTDPRGYVRRTSFNSSHYGVSDTFPYGLPEAQTVSYARNPANGLIDSVTDALGRVTANTYYPSGDLQTTTTNSGTADAALTSFTYDPTWNDLATITDPLTHVTTFHYDGRGNRDSETDPLNHATTFTYYNNGQLWTTTNALQKTVTFAYQAADLVSVTDPLGRVTRRFSDAAGRPVYGTDALGNRARTDYDTLNRVTQVVDPRGGTTIFTYDDNGNRLTVKDARNNVTTYTYNNMDQVATRKDALLRTESYTYDPNGNLLTVTDRKAQVTEFRYDSLNRQTFAGFKRTGTPPNYSFESTIDYGPYDNGNRLTHVHDSATNTNIDRSYYPSDLLQQETTATGVSVSYEYDLAGRRTRMVVTGQSDLYYCYDNADRLSAIKTAGSCSGTTLVGFGYDNADRRTTLTLPNSALLTYGYDDVSQLKTMTWSGPTVGTLAYDYDAVGRRVTMSGSFARLNLPAAVTTTIYDANNRLTKWGNKTISYDNNGNMLGDLNNTYTWNARDQLTAVTKQGQTLPSFTYDAFGRRLTKTLGTTTTTYRYDGANTVQEKQGASVTASILTGLGVDEVFQRTDGATVRSFVTDALGSTLALADSAGAVQTSYTYAPYGETTASGVSSANTSQFTGRENDADGLYYYRARYYHPVFGRFVSEDPIEFGGGDPSLYAYASGNPISVSDPSGNCGVFAAINVAITVSTFVLGSRKNEKTLGDWVKLGLDIALDVACVGIVSKLRNLVVIGETQSRVHKVARILTGTRGEMPNLPMQLTEAAKKSANASWIRSAMDQARVVVDVGRNPARVLRGEGTGAYYALEQSEIAARAYSRVVTWPSGLGGQIRAFLRIMRM
jgi:RHS repeat-associated protein